MRHILQLFRRLSIRLNEFRFRRLLDKIEVKLNLLERELVN